MTYEKVDAGLLEVVERFVADVDASRRFGVDPFDVAGDHDVVLTEPRDDRVDGIRVAEPTSRRWIPRHSGHRLADVAERLGVGAPEAPCVRSEATNLDHRLRR